MENKVNFQSYDGTALVGILNRPVAVKGALLMVHGVPSEKNEWGFYSDMAHFMSERNIASFRFDLRYNGESQSGDLSDLSLSNICSDIESAYWQLVKHLDPETPVAIVGTSFSGGVTVKWVNFCKKKIQQVFLMAPVLDYDRDITGNRLRANTDSYVAMPEEKLALLKKDGVLDEEVHYGYQMINEAHWFDIQKELAELSCPVTVFQGDADTLVPLAITKDYVVNRPGMELILVPDADHGFAVEGDDDLTFPGTKQNHYFVYEEQFKRLIK